MKGYLRWVLLGLCAQVALFSPIDAGAVTYSTGFDSTLDGWSAYAFLGSSLANFMVTTGSELMFQPSGGNPGGYMEFTDVEVDRTTWFLAPVGLLGDWSDNDGGSITFDQKVFDGGSASPLAITPYAVALIGPGGVASWQGSNPSTYDWVSVMVPIHEGSWNVTSGSWDALLDDVMAFGIKAELISNSSDVVGVDNIVIAEAPSVPIPGAVWLLGSGLIGITGLRKKFDK